MPRRHDYTPDPAFFEAWPEGVSGNARNGLGETAPRRASPMFWHPPDRHPFGPLQVYARARSRANPEAAAAFAAAYDYPELPERTARQVRQSPEAWEEAARAFALSHEADLFGATAMRDDYIVEGYEIDLPNVIVLGFAHEYDKLKEVPSTPENAVGVVEIGRQYARGTRAAYALAGWIREQGYNADPYPGPAAANLLLIPPAIAAGLGELGKHGSLINRTYGSGFRLAGVATDLPLALEGYGPDVFGADEFCHACQACANACPPDAIAPEKQMVRGTEKWYVDFDKCIPYFAEYSACGICIAVCPWTRPGVADNLLQKMAAARARKANA